MTNGSATIAYSYLANSPLVSQITFKQSGTTQMTTTKQYDYLNRLGSISSTSNSFVYQYTPANQRNLARLVDGSYWRYRYDALGQVVSGSKYWSDGTPVAGQQFDYTFDTIGNRTQTEAGGDQNGANLRLANYTNNSLNQITSRDVPGDVDVMGLAIATNTITVNGLAAYRKGEYFRQQLAVTNGSAALWTNITVIGGLGSVNGNAYVAQTPEDFSYDADGNLTQDGRWTYTWNAENRLVNMTSLTNAPSGSKLQLAFTYDYQGRRIQKLVSTNSGTAYVPEYTNRIVYDGWNLIGELAPNGSLIRSYVWGMDLSGSAQGAGGVGGLLQMSYYGSSTTNCFVSYDGNGNVAALVNAADGTVAAQYDYGPFGEVIRTTGPMAKVNPAREGTKIYDDETDLVYYGYRYYNPSTGRWLSRDSVEETGENNLYGFVRNQAVNRLDLLGHVTLEYTVQQLPAGQQNGKSTSWNITWKLPPETPTGYIIQEITWTFSVQECPPSDGFDIWNQLGYQGSTRFHYWEAWRKGDRTTLGGRDGWLLPQGSHFFSNPTAGSMKVTGNAAFYEVTELADPSNEADQLKVKYAGNWVQNGEDDSGSPMSGDLFATSASDPPTLPNVDEMTKRSETWTWCCDSLTAVIPTGVYDRSH